MALRQDGKYNLRFMVRFSVPSVKASWQDLAETWSLIPFAVPTPLRRQRREFAAVGLEIDQRRLIEAIEAPHQNGRTLDPDQLDDRGANRIRPNWRAQRKRAAGQSIFLGAL